MGKVRALFLTIAPQAHGTLPIRSTENDGLTHVKVLVKLFQKLAQWRARSPPRAPQSAKCSRRFLFDNFFFCASCVKRKSGHPASLYLWLLTPPSLNPLSNENTRTLPWHPAH